MSKKPHVLIAGAGLGGLTAALALLQRGFDVDVYEQATELKEIGAGVQIGPNGSRVLFELGLAKALNNSAVEAAGKEIRLWNTGQTFKLFDLGSEAVGRYGSPYLLMHRADLHSILAEAVLRHKPNSIHLNAKCSGYAQDGNTVRLVFENGETAQGDVLIGADGLHSRIRQQLVGADKAKFTGGVCWRGIVPMNRLPAHLTKPVGANWVGPHGHIIHYPVRRGELMNFVGHVERDDWQVESWTERGTISECIADFAGWHDDIQEMIRNIEVPFKWALFLREPLKKWGEGRVSLLGDACHATLPYLAQGANMAIEDGLVLGRALHEYRDDLSTALRRYEDARRERTTRIVNKSAENLNRFHNADLADPAVAERYTATEWHPDRIRERYDWLFEYDATAVAL
jgi:salicylate hydroxylase